MVRVGIHLLTNIEIETCAGWCKPLRQIIALKSAITRRLLGLSWQCFDHCVMTTRQPVTHQTKRSEVLPPPPLFHTHKIIHTTAKYLKGCCNKWRYFKNICYCFYLLEILPEWSECRHTPDDWVDQSAWLWRKRGQRPSQAELQPCDPVHGTGLWWQPGRYGLLLWVVWLVGGGRFCQLKELGSGWY